MKLGISIPNDVWNELTKKKGDDVPTSTFITKLLRKSLGMKEVKN